jgi:hypothetical protein
MSMFLAWLEKRIRKPLRVHRHHVPGFRPRIESLEDRTVPSFFTAPTFPVGTTPVAVAVGDFNGDGKLDLAVVNQGSKTMSVLLGNGDGTEQTRTDYAVGADHRQAVRRQGQDSHRAVTVLSARSVLGWREPSPLPSSTLTVLAPKLAVTMSSLPSPLKSPTATATGVVPR